MSHERKPAIDPVVLTALGIGLLTFAIVMLAFQDQSGVALGADTSSVGQIVIAFITGLTTGGLSCLAVQGGLLASSLAHQIEQDYLEQSAQPKTREKRVFNYQLPASEHCLSYFALSSFKTRRLHIARRVTWLARFVFHTQPYNSCHAANCHWYLHGWQCAAHVQRHPIFRYFSIEPPKFITRYIRHTAKGTDTATPLFLGALTVFIPCGVTQAIMATALGTGSVVLGAALMFAFTLGTSPVFFIIAYITTEIGARLEKFFMRFVAVVLLILGFVTLDGGLNLIGSPLSIQNFTRNLIPSSNVSTSVTNSPQSSIPGDELVLSVENSGYFPSTLKAPAGKDLKLNLVTNGTFSCALDFLIPALDFHQMLPPVGTVQVNIPAQEKGSTLYFTCSMGMYTGQIVFE